MAARGIPVAGDSSTGGESRLWQSWWSVHAPELGLSENLVGNSYRRRVVPTVIVVSERLCDDCYMTGVRHSRWMDRHN